MENGKKIKEVLEDFKTFVSNVIYIAMGVFLYYFLIEIFPKFLLE